jgi:cold-inducible RNA-binding protein
LSQKIYVGNLGFSVTSENLKKKFEQYGVVQSARVVTDRDTGRSKGFGFIEMSNSQEASDAISALNGSDYEGRRMTVNEAKPEAPRDRSRFMNSR